MSTSPQTLIERFCSFVQSAPDNPAVQDGRVRWSYAQLERASNHIAAQLTDRLGTRSEPVLQLLASGALSAAATLGVLKAGKFYVPLDPDFPLARNDLIARESQARVLVSSAEHREQAERLAAGRFQFVLAEPHPEDGPDNPSAAVATPDSPAFVIYTSGSTGVPKGVLHTHASLVHNAWRQSALMHFSAADRMSSLYSPSVMGHVRDFYNALLNGAGLWSFDLRAHGVARLVAWLASQRITVLHTIASVFRRLPPTLAPVGGLPDLRLLILGGESVLASDFEIFRRHFPDRTQLFTGLGATETGTARGLLVNAGASIDEHILPLGFPMPDVDIEIVGPDRRALPVGEVGEIAVDSAYLAQGYWNRPELTAAVFAPAGGGRRRYYTGDLGRMRPDGCLLYAGRIDTQVKLRGYRVETTEIEAAILRSGRADDAAVVLCEPRPGLSVLVAYVVVREGQAIDGLRPALANSLPDYMVPAVFMPMDALPLTPNGKVAREALPPPTLDVGDSQAGRARDDVETELLRIWRDLLSIESIGIHEDFFQIGGDSLAASLMALEIERRFEVELPLALFLERRTVAQIAEWLRSRGAAPGFLVPVQPGGCRPPLFVVPGGYGNVLFLRDLARYLGPDQPVFALQSTRSAAGLRQYYLEVEEVAATYLEEIRRQQPSGPYLLAGYSFGGYVALEMAHRLRDQGQPVDLLVLLDTYPPGPRRAATPGQRWRLHADNLRRLPLGRWPEYAAGRLRSLALKTTQLEVVRRGLRRLGYVPRQPMVASRIARYGYRPRPYPGEAVLIRARRRQSYVRWDPMERWPAYVCGRLTVLDVDGAHRNILHEPHVQQVAAHLRRLLDERSGESPSGT